MKLYRKWALCLLGVFMVFLVGVVLLGYTGWRRQDRPTSRVEEKREIQARSAAQVQDAAELYRQGLADLEKGDFERALVSFGAFLRMSPRGVQAGEARYLLADAYFHEAGEDLPWKFQKVLDAYQSALSHHPRSARAPWARLQLGEVYRRLGLFYEALASLDILLAHYPSGPYHLEAQKKKAACLVKVGRYREAEQTYRAISTASLSESDRVEVTLGLAAVLLYQGEAEKALERYRAVSGEFPAALQSDPSARYFFGEALFKNRHFREARETFEPLVERFPQEHFSPSAANRIADCFLEEGNVESALESYQKVLVRYPDSDSAISARVRMADIGVRHPAKEITNKGRAGVAYELYLNPLETYRQVASSHPEHPLAEVALYRRGVALKEAKRLEEAVSSLQEALRRFPKGFLKIETMGALGEALEQLVGQYHNQGKYDRVVGLYRHEVLPYLGVVVGTKTLWRVAESYEQLGIWERTEELYRRLALLSREPDQQGLAMLRLARVFFLQEKFAEALEQLQGVVSRFFDSALLSQARHLQGELFFRQGKLRDAEEALRQALAGQTETARSARIRYLLGNCYWELGETSRAVEAYQQVLQGMENKEPDKSPEILTPPSATRAADRSAEITPPPATRAANGDAEIVRESRFRLADALYGLRKYDEAAQAYVSVIQLYPEDERRKRANYRLSECYEKSHREEAAASVLISLADSGTGAWAQMAAEKLQDMGRRSAP